MALARLALIRTAPALASMALAGRSSGTVALSLSRRHFQTNSPPYFGSVPVYVRDVLRRKREGTKVFTVDENETVFKATERMVANNIGSLAVTRKGRMIGIVTERDYLRKVVHEGRTSHDTAVEAISTLGSEVVVCTPNDTVQDCLDILLSYNIRHLPVVTENGDCVGMLSIRDLAMELTQPADVVAENLDDYMVENSGEASRPKISTRRWR